MKKIRDFIKKVFCCCPVWCKVIIVVGAVGLILQIFFTVSAAFADFYNRYIGAFFRMLLAKLTGWIPFSVAETLFMLIPLLITVAAVVTVRVSKKPIREMVKYTFCLFSLLLILFVTFSFNFSAGYKGSPLDEKLGAKRRLVTPEELKETAELLLAELDGLTDEVEFLYGSSSLMPYTVSEMSDKLSDACVSAAEKYEFLPSFRSNVKSIVLSKPMTYTHISGVYTYFTGESNININFPDYTLPYTAAHELSHQRGVAREDEANFMAFLICRESDDPYIRYSGYMGLYEYVISALYEADTEAYSDVLNRTDIRLRYEMAAYNEFFKKYENSVASSVSSTINDTYLKMQGQKAGERSYGMVVDLAVAYLLPTTD